MIEEWSSRSPEEKMKALIREMEKEYYRARKIDKIPEAIELKELLPGTSSSLDFFRIAHHSSVPYQYLEMDTPIIGMGRMGGSIALGEDKALVDCVSSNESVSSEQLVELDFNNLITETYKKISSICAIFYPIKFFTQINKELNIKFSNDIDDFMVIDTGIDEIKMIHSTNFSKWEQIVVLGSNSIEWTRKLSFIPPPNLYDYQVFSKDNDHFQSAYKMTIKEVKFMIGTLNNCCVIDSDNVIVYFPPSSGNE